MRQIGKSDAWYLTLCMLLILPLASCTKETIADGPLAVNAPCFFAETPSGDGTRTFLDGKLNICWDADDRISVFRSEGNAQYRFAGKTGADYGRFELVGGKYPEPVYEHNYAIYPYHAENASTGDGIFEISLPGEQTYAEDSFGRAANTMVAVTKSQQDSLFKFKNTCGYLMLKIYGGYTIKSVRLTGHDGEKIAGPAILDATVKDSPSLTMKDAATAEIVLDCGEPGVKTGGSSDESTKFILVVPPTTFAHGFKVELTDSENEVHEISTTKSITISRNTIKQMAPRSLYNLPEGIGCIDEMDPKLSTYLDFYGCVKDFDGFIDDSRLHTSKYATLLKVLDDCNIPVADLESVEDKAAIFRHAKALMDSIIVLDTHCDFQNASKSGKNTSIDQSQSPRQISIEKMNQGHTNTQYLAFMGSGVNLDPKVWAAAPASLWTAIEEMDKHLKEHSDVCGKARNKEEILQLKKEGKKAFLYGLEPGYWAGPDLANISKLASYGFTYITLCHFGDNQICHSSNNSEDPSKGLTDFGREFVKEMNRVGMVIDISHTSWATQREVIALSPAPVVFSHSGSYSMCANARNVDDETLKMLAAKGGVIQILMYPGYMGGSGAGLKQFIQHLDYCVKLIGADHVGVGLDLDGGGGGKDLNGINDAINITVELIKLGYTDADITKIWGENYLRVLAAAQAMKAPDNCESFTKEQGKW